jgi:hypothetical protein
LNVRDLISGLEGAKEPSRFLDRQIVQLMGWQKTTGPIGGDGRPTVRWIPPGASRPRRCPLYTSDLQEAYGLALQIDPEHAGAFVREGDTFRAQLEGGPVAYGATPSIALCIAALKFKYQFA